MNIFTDLVAFPSEAILAEDLFSEGMTSCAEAERLGWMVTPHEPTRKAVDARLAVMWDYVQF